MDYDGLAGNVTIRIRVANLVLLACLLCSLSSTFLTVDNEHVDAEKDTAASDDCTDNNGDICITTRIVATITVAVTVAASRVRAAA